MGEELNIGDQSPANDLVSQAPGPTGYNQVIDFLSEQLVQGRLKVGDRLLPERDLAVRLNISRPVVREALRALSMIGVLDVQQGRGTFVRAPDFSVLGRMFSFMFAQNGNEVDDIIELRQGIERHAVRLACVRARTGDLEKIRDAMDQIRSSIDDPVAGGSADFLFHTRIVEASHSSALIKVYAVVSRMLQENHVARRKRIAATDQLHDYIIDHHEQMLRAIQRRDVEASESLLNLHFEIGDKLNSA